MSSLWTPGGEHPVEKDSDSSKLSNKPSETESPGLDDLSVEEREQAEALAKEMAAVREQVAATPASVVIANHLMGFYELAAIHLSQNPPNFKEASLAIDALSSVMDALPERLGEAEATLRDALHQIRLAYVQLQENESEDQNTTEN
tara:strand:+ start:156 stop:593 length:438 start_codon:yes stop_codon:yes gene_type:complete